MCIYSMLLMATLTLTDKLFVKLICPIRIQNVFGFDSQCFQWETLITNKIAQSRP